MGERDRQREREKNNIVKSTKETIKIVVGTERMYAECQMKVVPRVAFFS